MVSSSSLFIKLSSGDKEFDSRSMVDQVTFMCVCVCVLHWLQLCATPRTVARQAFLSMGFPRQAHWSQLLCLPPGDLSFPRIEPTSPVSTVLQAGSLPMSHGESKVTFL